MIPLNTKVKVVDDVGKTNSFFLGKIGIVIDYKPNKFRPENTVPIVQLDNGEIISGWSLWYEIQTPLTWKEVYPKFSHQQIKELLIDSFGEKEAKFHTLDEIPFCKLINKS